MSVSHEYLNVLKIYNTFYYIIVTHLIYLLSLLYQCSRMEYNLHWFKSAFRKVLLYGTNVELVNWILQYINKLILTTTSSFTIKRNQHNSGFPNNEPSISEVRFSNE